MSDASSLPVIPPILAMVIGINSYPRERYENLKAAIADADHFEAYLTGSLAKLSGQEPQIISLRDATRRDILDGFLSLQNNYTELKDRAAIIIFYAGHGASTRKPKEWSNWHTSSGDIEMLCPSDIGLQKQEMVNGEKRLSVVEGIYDRTISALLNRLSEAMGPNITLIMDCCCSGGITRGGTDAPDELIREIFDPPPALAESDEAIWQDEDRGGGAADGFSGRLHGSHVLLAACGPDECACESRVLKYGYFTHGLLELLEKEDVLTLTYTSLMHKLKVNNRRQTPRCEGHGLNWRLFNNRESGSDWSFILTHRNDRNIVTLEAGTAQGLTVGSCLSAHTTNLINSPSVGELVVKSVKMFSAVLEVSQTNSEFQPPDLFYSKLVHTADCTIKLHCENRYWLELTFPDQVREKFGICLVNDAENCDLELVLSNEKVYFDRHHKLVIPHLKKRIHHEVDAKDLATVRKVVCASCTFYYHLTRPMIDRSTQAEIELVEVHYPPKPEEPMVSGADTSTLEEILVPKTSTNLIDNTRADIEVDEDALYGMTILSKTNTPLYPFVFYFDPTDLTIVEWYPPPFDIGGGNLDAPSGGSGTSKQAQKGLLMPNSSLTIGYRESVVWPWGFTLEDGVTKDMGFRVFLSTHPMPSFFSMKQASPFPLLDDRGAGARAPRLTSCRPHRAQRDRCGSQLVTIV